MLCQIVKGPQIQNLTLKYCCLIGRRAEEDLDCYPKMRREKKFALPFLDHAFFEFYKSYNIK